MADNAIIDLDVWKEAVSGKAAEFGFPTSDLEATKVPGYFTSLNIELMKNCVLLHNVGVRERYATTAKKDNSILKMAADRNIELTNAKPSYMKALLILSVADIKAYMVDNETDVYVIEKETPIYVDSTPFSLYYDIEIRIQETSTIDVYKVEYVRGDDGFINPLDTDNVYTKPINVVKTIMSDIASITDDNNAAIGLVLDVRQYIYENTQCRYLQNISTEIQVATYTNQLADFTVRYAETEYIDDSSKRYLEKRNSFVVEDSTDEVIYYRKNGTGVLQLFNRITGNFIPATNSIIDITCLSTKGASGNFSYSGSNISIAIDSLIRYKIMILTQPAGGKDSPTIEKMRNDLVTFSSTRGTITNEEDLKKYYTENLGMYKISKLRHDFYSLTFSVISALKHDSLNMYYPTNTLDFHYYIDLEDLAEDNNYLIINTDELISYEYGIATNKQLTEDDVLHYRYTIPYIMVYNTKTNTVSVYEKTFNRTYHVTRVDVSDESSFTMIMNKFQFNKYASTSPVITSLVTTTRDIESDSPVLGSFNDGGQFIDNGSMVVRAVVKNQGLFVGYKDMDITDYNDSDKYYTITLANFAENYPYGNNVNLYLKDKSGNEMTVLTPISNIFIEYEIFVKAEDGSLRNHGYSDLQEYIMVNKYKSDEITMYNNISHINNIQITTNDSALVFKEVPVVGLYGYQVDSAGISARLQYELDKLQNIYNLTPQNHQICLRFANTYGFSNRYKVGYDINKELDQLSLAIYLTIKLKQNTILTTSEVIEFINDEVMKIDFNNGDFLHIGNILDSLKQKYTQIAFVEFGGFNELPAVYTYIGLDLTTTEAEYSIPEILNVNHVYDDALGYVPEIYVTFV